jgi:preprotein translocase subunit SecE
MRSTLLGVLASLEGPTTWVPQRERTTRITTMGLAQLAFIALVLAGIAVLIKKLRA